MLALLFACVAADASADDVCAGEFQIGVADEDSRNIGVQVPDDAGEYSIHVDLRWPLHARTVGESWPVVVVLHGGWDQQGTPLTGDSARPDVGFGLVALHVDLPGHGRSDGENDRRGAASRAAVAAVMRYAMGDVPDSGGCTMADRAGAGAEPGPVWLMGLSNGGNLAASVLADPALDLPEVGGLVTWETPVSPIFVNVELGKDPTVYTSGSCSVDLVEGVSCPFPAQTLAEGPEDLCFDQNDDSACTDDDIAVQGTEDPITGLRMISPALRRAADERGLGLQAYADAETTDAWWSERDAVRAATALVARHPQLPVMLLGSEDDHVLPWDDHPHIFAWGEALQKAGAFWTRLNPGDEWLAENDTPNDPNAPLLVSDPNLHLLTEQEEDPLEATLAAAIQELAARRANNDW